MKQPLDRTLIYDRDVSGHHLDYLQFLVEYLKRMPESVRQQYVFVLNEEAQKRFANDQAEIRFHFIAAPQLAEFLQHTNVLRRAAAEMKFLKKLLDEYDAKRLIFMHIDAFQFELGRLSLRRKNIKLSGLMFLPFRKYYEDDSTLSAVLRREWRGWRKGMQMRWMLRNRQIERMFFLNDKQGVEDYTKRFGPYFEYLPDPIELRTFENTPLETLRHKYSIPDGRKVFLIYGHLSSRKNIPNILLALRRLTVPQREQLCILISGEPEKGYETTLQTALSEAKLKCPEVMFVEHIRFFDPADTHDVFRIADVVLVPYINFFSSSNILGLAAKHNKPLIASKLGIMGVLVHQYQLGTTVAPQSVREIAEAIQQHLGVTAEIDGQKYLNDHTADEFSKKILF
jgi:glycosyltransferase involved in cell wall biosynthesis